MYESYKPELAVSYTRKSRMRYIATPIRESLDADAIGTRLSSTDKKPDPSVPVT